MINKFSPAKTIRFHSNDKFFMTSKIKEMIHARNCAQDNISGNHNKDSAKWWKKINKLTGRNKSNNFSLTNPESQSIMNDKETANCINSFFVGLTKDFPCSCSRQMVNEQ